MLKIHISIAQTNGGGNLLTGNTRCVVEVRKMFKKMKKACGWIHNEVLSWIYVWKIFSALGEIGARRQKETQENIVRERGRRYSYDV